MREFTEAERVLRQGVEARAFPAAVAEVGTRTGVHWRQAAGHLTYELDAPATTPDTIFDLASLTKVIVATTLTMRWVDEGALRLEDPIARWIPEWDGAERAEVTIADLLAHCSGLPAYHPFYRNLAGRREFQHAIARAPLQYEPRRTSIYSDLGFMLLGFILEDVGGAGLDVQFGPVAASITAEPFAFRPGPSWRARTAPTEEDAWRGRTLVGEVHDENAWALGGVAAHAGLFGTASAVGAFARSVLETFHGTSILASPRTLRTFVRKGDVPRSSRALGWDTMLPTSSCGTLMSPTSIGHTGFTGTSLWIDLVRDLYVVLLTNRVHPTRANDGITRIRPKFHDAAVAEL